MRRAGLAVLCLLPLLLLASCSRQAPPPPTDAVPADVDQPFAGPSEGEKGAADQGAAGMTLAVIPKGTTHEFWKSIHAGALKAAEELGVEIIWKGPLKEDNRDDQIKIVEDMINRGVNGIVLAPLDDVALGTPVEDAVRKEIPVVIIDSALKSEAYTSFVSTDNYNGGKLAGEHMVKLLGGKGKVAMLRYAEGSASTAEREQGFMDAVVEAKEIEVVSSNQYGGATTETAYKASENLLAPYKTADGLGIDGIFACNESTTFGMLRALQDAKLAGKVTFIGFDSSEKLVDALSGGELSGLVLQDPMNMGYLGVKTMVAHLKGEAVDKRISTGETLATKDNMNDPKIQALLAPDYRKWLKEE
jgi:ribose transport system substrate-binding protein